MAKTRVRVALAMRIVNLDRIKFNEAVANDCYPCAPPTTQGASRVFSEDDLIVLYVFARLLELNVSLRTAGHLACEFKSQMGAKGNEGSDRIVYVKSESMGHFFASKNYDPDHEKNDREYRGIGRIVLSIEFYVSTIRNLITERIEHERNILGAEDGE